MAIGAGIVAGAALLLLAAVLGRGVRSPRLTDERLIGTWQSDADRTMAGRPDQKPGNEAREAKFRKLFGKLRITYTADTFTSDFDGAIEIAPYEVLGKDASSVVIRDLDDKPSPLDEIFTQSKFHVIHFDGPDTYWLDSELGQIREYFRRLP